MESEMVYRIIMLTSVHFTASQSHVLLVIHSCCCFFRNLTASIVVVTDLRIGRCLCGLLQGWLNNYLHCRINLCTAALVHRHFVSMKRQGDSTTTPSLQGSFVLFVSNSRLFQPINKLFWKVTICVLVSF